MSVIVCLGLAWVLVTPESLAHVATGELVALLGLLVVPAAMLLCWATCRRAAPSSRRAESPGAAPASREPPPAPPDPAPAPTVPRHAARARAAAHRHRVHAARLRV
ncbi:MAG TPA: hypothetical protein VD963_03680 [Phycisphaerales bacterium]|nr:hypothetical protein [Phycisphaerales bacterium]